MSARINLSAPTGFATRSESIDSYGKCRCEGHAHGYTLNTTLSTGTVPVYRWRYRVDIFYIIAHRTRAARLLAPTALTLGMRSTPAAGRDISAPRGGVST